MIGQKQPTTLGTFAFILWGLIVWGPQFTAVYVVHTWFCACGMSAAAIGIAVGALTALTVVLQLPVAVTPVRVAEFVGLDADDKDAARLISIGRTIAVLSVVAALWTGATAAVVQSCVLAR
ncbi:MAG: hypothetical protein JJ913_15910 [Rhizobiaceae bacterium]|nr:hypothetical protein [Rhizobiaceae bacterium]